LTSPESAGSESLAVTVLVTTALEGLGVPYVIGGSMASAVYGMARATMDVDVVVDLREEHVAPFVASLGTDFYADALSIRDAIERRASCNLIHLPTMFKVDLFVVGDRAWDRQQLARRQRRSLSSADGPAAEVASAEDVILAKLDWYRLGNQVSDRQWRDVLSIIAVQGERLDRSYLNLWAESLGVADLLRRAQEEARG
jgi:hypothetical protein